MMMGMTEVNTPVTSSANVTVDSTGTLLRTTTATASYTGLTVGTATGLLALISTDNVGTVSSINWDSTGTPQGLTVIGTKQTGTSRLELWGLIGTITAGNKTLAVNLAALANVDVCAISFAGATAFQNFNSGNNSSNTISLAINSGTGHIVVANGVDGSGLNNATTPSDTQIYLNNGGATGIEANRGAGSSPTKTLTQNYDGNGTLLIAGCDVT